MAGEEDGEGRCPTHYWWLAIRYPWGFEVAVGVKPPWREVGCAVNPTLGHRALGTEPRGLVWRVPARLGVALCSRQLAKIIDSSFCWQQD